MSIKWQFVPKDSGRSLFVHRGLLVCEGSWGTGSASILAARTFWSAWAGRKR